MVRFKSLKTKLAYARLGLLSLGAVVAPITSTAQELCGSDLFIGEPDAAELMDQTLLFLDVLESEGVTAFVGREGRIGIMDARQALQDGIGSASLLACVVDAEGIEFEGEEGAVVISCNATGAASLAPQLSATTGSLERPQTLAIRSIADTLGSPASALDFGRSSGALFCTTEVAAFAQYMGSQA